MSLQNTSGEAHVELRTMPDSLGHDEESPLNSSENSVGSDATNEGNGGGESSVASASFNFINTIVGAGVIGIPYSIYQAGALCPDSTKGIRLTLPLAVRILCRNNPFDCFRRRYRLQRSAAH